MLTSIFLAHSLLHCFHTHCHHTASGLLVLFVACKRKQSHKFAQQSLLPRCACVDLVDSKTQSKSLSIVQSRVSSPGFTCIWHSKVEKIVNNFHGQTCSNLMVKHTFLWAKLIFLVLRSCKFSWSVSIPFQWQNLMLKIYFIPMTKFDAQNQFHSNDKISCSKPIPFHF